MAKIGLISSSGGHWDELMCLKDLTNDNDCFYVTEGGGQITDSKLQNVYTVPQINRHEKWFIAHFFKLFILAKKILHNEKPDAVITTGALMAYPFCVIAKIMKIKVIYIESFARITDSSLTGKMVYPIADLFLVQWESLLDVYPKAIYVGGIF